MSLHIFAHRRQTSAHRLHCSASYFAHSVAQDSHADAQTRAISRLIGDSRAHRTEHDQQTAAQSTHFRRHSAIVASLAHVP